MQLSIARYAAKCVLAAEILYPLCLLYGSSLSDNARALHHSLFELIPWFTWGNPASYIWGAVYLAIVSFIGGCYIAWMINSSMVSGRKN